MHGCNDIINVYICRTMSYESRLVYAVDDHDQRRATMAEIEIGRPRRVQCVK